MSLDPSDGTIENKSIGLKVGKCKGQVGKVIIPNQ